MPMIGLLGSVSTSLKTNGEVTIRHQSPRHAGERINSSPIGSERVLGATRGYRAQGLALLPSLRLLDRVHRPVERGLEASPVEGVDTQRREIGVFQAADVDRDHLASVRTPSPSEGANAA